MALECVHLQTLHLHDRDGQPTPNHIVLGQVIGIHISDDVLTDGLFDTQRVKPIARLGYMEYTVVDEVFAMQRPSAAE